MHRGMLPIVTAMSAVKFSPVGAIEDRSYLQNILNANDSTRPEHWFNMTSHKELLRVHMLEVLGSSWPLAILAAT